MIKEVTLMTSIASLEELKEMRKVYIGLLYNAKDERQINYLIKELNLIQEVIAARLKK